jgi:hypothetical protein
MTKDNDSDIYSPVDEQNFLLFAEMYYTNINCVEFEEFEEDLKRIKYVKKLFKKYRETGELKERLILNHLIVLYNVFEPEACTHMLCFKMNDYLEFLKPFLIFLSYWPDQKVINIDNLAIVNSMIGMDTNIVETLRNI